MTDINNEVLLEKLNNISEDVRRLEADVAELKLAYTRGKGVLLGMAVVLGLFAGELINAAKRLVGMPVPPT